MNKPHRTRTIINGNGPEPGSYQAWCTGCHWESQTHTTYHPAHAAGTRHENEHRK